VLRKEPIGSVTDTMRSWVEESAYGRGLGVRLAEASGTGARLSLPYREPNSNPGGALHGGCAASLGLIGGQVVARLALGKAMAPFHTAACQVSYLAAAIEEDVTATTALSRKGKELCFAETAVETAEGKPIARISTVVRGRAGAEPASPASAHRDHGIGDPGPMGPFVSSMPFASARQMVVEHMAGGTSRIAMPLGDANADLDGPFHEGAVLALLDTTGAMAAWGAVGPGRFKASSAAIQAQILGPVQSDDLVGFGHVVQRDDELFWSDVEIADAPTGELRARGTVVYRIVS